MKNKKRPIDPKAAWKQPESGLVRMYVWEWPVRFCHWLLVGTIVTLSITGFYMHAPYVAAHSRTSYVMGTMRFVHLLAGYLFLSALLLRLVWFFVGNQWARWQQFIPTSKSRWKQLIEVSKYYAFLSWSPARFIGHNPMAGAAYVVVYLLVTVEAFTGLTLLSQTGHSHLLTALVGWVPLYIDIQWLRTIHFLIMFAFWMFFIHHIYTAILVSVEEGDGLMDSIFSGYKFVPEAEAKEAAKATENPDAAQALRSEKPARAGGQSAAHGM